MTVQQTIENESRDSAKRRENVLRYITTTFPVLTITPYKDDGVRVRIRKSIGELMHALGYYGDQNSHDMRDLSLHQRLLLMADVIRFIAENLEPPQTNGSR